MRNQYITHGSLVGTVCGKHRRGADRRLRIGQRHLFVVGSIANQISQATCQVLTLVQPVDGFSCRKAAALQPAFCLG